MSLDKPYNNGENILQTTLLKILCCVEPRFGAAITAIRW